MFLNQLKDSKKKELFLELAYLVSVSGDKTAKTKDSSKIPLIEFLSSEEMNTLKNCAKDLDSLYLEEMFEAKPKYSFDNFFAPSFSNVSDVSLNGIISSIIAKILSQYSENPIIKKTVIDNLVNSGFDILSIDKKLVEKEIISLSEIKKEIIEDCVFEIIIKKRGLNLSDKDKKIILFELMSLLYKNGNFSPSEKNLLKVVCKTLELDEEYLDEFDEVTGQYILSMKEIIELINE